MKMIMIESQDKTEFLAKVNGFLCNHQVFTCKFQRNLYYSLSGSTHVEGEMHKETSHLKEGYLAFIVYYTEDDYDLR